MVGPTWRIWQNITTSLPLTPMWSVQLTLLYMQS